MFESASGFLLLERAAAAVSGGVGLYDVEGGQLVPLGGGITAVLGHSAATTRHLDRDGLRALVHGEDQERLETWIRRISILDDGESAGETLRLRHADGGWRRLHVNAAVLIRNAKRHPTAVLATLTPLPPWPWPGPGGATATVPGDPAALLALLLEHMPERLTVSGGPPDFPITVISRRARELFGREVDRLSELPTARPRRGGLYLADGRKVPPGEQVPPLRATRYGEAIAGEEWLIRRPDRSEVAVEVHAVPIRDGRGVVGAVCSWRDAGERKRLEQALQERAEQFALLVRSTRAGLWSYESASGELSLSDECAGLLGWPRDRRPTREGLLAVIHAADRQAVTRAFDLALRECAPVALDFRVALDDGGERWLSTAAECHCDDDGRSLRLFGVMTDITARKRADAALRESEERFRQLAGTIHEMFWVLDPVKFKWLYVSPAYERLFVRDGKQPEVRTWLAAVHPDDRARVGRILAGEVDGTEFSQEYRLLTPRGIRRMRDHGLVSRDATGRPTRLVGLTEDLAERRHASPCRAYESARPTVDAARLVQGAAAGLAPLLARRRQRLQVEVASAPMPLHGDRTMLLRTVAQLIELVASSMEEGATVVLHATPRNGVAVLHAGGGGGLSAEFVDRLLDLEVCADGAEDSEGGRLAAILATVREQAAGHGGSISLEAGGRGRPGRFVLRLPLAEPAPAPARKAGERRRDAVSERDDQAGGSTAK